MARSLSFKLEMSSTSWQLKTIFGRSRGARNWRHQVHLHLWVRNWYLMPPMACRASLFSQTSGRRSQSPLTSAEASLSVEACTVRADLDPLSQLWGSTGASPPAARGVASSSSKTGRIHGRDASASSSCAKRDLEPAMCSSPGAMRPTKVCAAHQDVALGAHYEPTGGAIRALQVSQVQVAGSRQQLNQGLPELGLR